MRHKKGKPLPVDGHAEGRWYEEEMNRRAAQLVIDPEPEPEPEKQEGKEEPKYTADTISTKNFGKENAVERSMFTKEDRQSILRKTGGICACCGKKLTASSMTVEHVIPVSRGGGNELDNLLPLCEDCNKDKGNRLYMPSGFYSALVGKPILDTLDAKFLEWFAPSKQEFDFHTFPLCSPYYNIYIDPLDRGSYPRKRTVYNRQFFIRAAFTGKTAISEVEAVTGLDIRYIRSELNDINGTEREKVAIYTLRRLSTDKILSVIAILLDPKSDLAWFYVPWTCVDKTLQGKILAPFVNIVLSTLKFAGGIEVPAYCVISEYGSIIDEFHSPYANIEFGCAFRMMESLPEGIHGIEIRV